MSAFDDFRPHGLTLQQWSDHKRMLDEIDRLRGRESQLEAQVETLEIAISRLRCVCDAAFSVVRDDGGEDGWTAWQELVSALEEARYEPRFDCGGVDCERQGAMIVHRPSCVRWES